MIRVTGLNIYPLKSAAALPLRATALDYLGFRGDRRFLVVDAPSGKFLTGREVGKLVTLQAQQLPQGLNLHALDLPMISGIHPTSNRMPVYVWDDQIDAVICQSSSTNLSEALSAWLGREVHLVAFDERSQRALDPKYVATPRQTAFSDGYPILLTSAASLRQLNAWRVDPTAPALSMARFRSNLVIDGDDLHAFAEDAWRTIQIGGLIFDLVKPCTRCIFTTVDCYNGARDPTQEPLHVLKQHRRTEKGVTFGVNVVARASQGVLALGDEVRVVERV